MREFFDPDLCESELSQIEAGDVLAVTRCLETALQVVAPRVVGTGDGIGAAAADQQFVAAMLANVVERAQAQALAARDDDVLVK
jgi:hypothetical protein